MNHTAETIGLTAVVQALAIVPPALAQSSGPRTTLGDAKRVVEAAQRTATTLNVRVSIAVVDGRPRGLVAVERAPASRLLVRRIGKRW